MRDEQLPKFAVLVVLASDERDKTSTLALTEEIVEKLVGLLSTPILYAPIFRHVNEVEVHWLTEIERR